MLSYLFLMLMRVSLSRTLYSPSSFDQDSPATSYHVRTFYYSYLYSLTFIKVMAQRFPWVQSPTRTYYFAILLYAFLHSTVQDFLR